VNLTQPNKLIHQHSNPLHLSPPFASSLTTLHCSLRLTDFGGSKATPTRNDDEDTAMSIVGTHSYVAPEIMNGDAYDLKVDVFSFAICLACLGVNDGLPRSLYSQSKGIRNIVEGHVSGLHFVSMHSKGERLSLDAFAWPQKMKDLVEASWNHIHELRPTFDEIAEEVSKWKAEDFGEVDD
jgi:serine/threonine protein kinase